MKLLLSASALALGLSLPSISSAQEVTVSSGFSVTSEYVSNGLKQSDGPAFQPWVEVGASGFYLGLWASNTSVAFTGSKYEVDIYGGYRGELGKFSYDVGYARYYYYKPYFDCCGEAYLQMGYAVSDKFDVAVKFLHDPTAKVTNSKLMLAYGVTDKISLSAEAGKYSAGGRSYGSVKASYAINDMFSVSASYHDSSVSKGLGVISLDASF